MTLLDEVLQLVERGERWFSAELNRHKGELLLRLRVQLLPGTTQ